MKITDSGIFKIGVDSIVEGYPELQSLDLWCCEEVTDVGVSKIGEGSPQLQSLNIYYREKVTDVGILKIVEGIQNYSLSIYGVVKK